MANNLICISDTHCGCRTGLCPPQTIHFDYGGYYVPSNFQQKVWAWWEEFQNVWIPTVTRGEPWDLLHNGDAIDGTHHGSTTQISQNINDQVTIAELALGPLVAACRASGGKYYHVRGTEAHVGKSGEYEERLAKNLGAEPDAEGHFARYELWKRVGDALVHALHHIGTSGSMAYETSAVMNEIAQMYTNAARWDEEPPDFVVRGHRHKHIEVRLKTYKGWATGVVIPSWQGKTPFAWKVPGARITEPQFGGVLIRQGDEKFFSDAVVWNISRSPIEP